MYSFLVLAFLVIPPIHLSICTSTGCTTFVPLLLYILLRKTKQVLFSSYKNALVNEITLSVDYHITLH